MASWLRFRRCLESTGDFAESRPRLILDWIRTRLLNSLRMALRDFCCFTMASLNGALDCYLADLAAGFDFAYCL